MIEYLEKPQKGPLEDTLECLWIAHTPKPLEPRETQRIVPDACPELLIHLGDPFERWSDGSWHTQPREFLAGTLAAPWLLRPGSQVRTISARFRPAAISRVFTIDMKTAVDREVPLVSVAGETSGAELVAALNASETTEQLFAQFESWLLEQQIARSLLSVNPLSRRAVERVLAVHGSISIVELARELDCHPRTLERAFSKDLGISPKRYARIVRLNAVLASLDEIERNQSVDLAITMGFFDQAHMLRDARLLAGRKLSASRNDDGSLGKHFTAPERLRQLLASAYHDDGVSHSSKLSTDTCT